MTVNSSANLIVDPSDKRTKKVKIPRVHPGRDAAGDARPGLPAHQCCAAP